MSRMSVDDHYDDWERRERLLSSPEELEWRLPQVEFARTENHFTNWVISLREPDPVGFEKWIAVLEERLQMIPEEHRIDAERGIPEAKKYYYRKFPLPRLTLRQLLVLASKKVGTLVRGLASQGSK